MIFGDNDFGLFICSLFFCYDDYDSHFNTFHLNLFD